MRPPSITIITPCYNESGVITRFLESLGETLATLPYSFCVIVVDDCSADDTLLLLNDFRFSAGNIFLKIISLESNVGHQVAIYHGFLYAQTLACDHFIVMDSDGEDAPAVIPALLQYTDTDIVNVVRGSRKESLLFRICYYSYKVIFRLMTGKQMNYGNFCLISRNVLETAIASNFSHLAAFLSKQHVNTHYIVAGKEKRIGGRSKMGFVKHFKHAIGSFAECRDLIKLPELLPIITFMILMIF